METLYNIITIAALLYPVAIVAIFALIATAVLILREEGTLSPVTIYHHYITKGKLPTSLPKVPNVPIVPKVSESHKPLGICRICGCTYDNACLHPDFGPCFWMDDTKQDLCSHCLELKDDPSVERINLTQRSRNLKKLQLCHQSRRQ